MIRFVHFCTLKHFCSAYLLYTQHSVVEDYAKWQLLLHPLSLYVAPLPDDSWKILRDIKFPKTAKLSDDTKLTCVEFIEAVMPLAVARPFVEEFITNSMENQVINFNQCLVC